MKPRRSARPPAALLDDRMLRHLGPLTQPDDGQHDRDGGDPASPHHQRCLECFLAGRRRRGELVITCGVCRVLMHETCYWSFAPAHERLYFDSLMAEDFEGLGPDDVGGPYLFLCRACREYRRRALAGATGAPNRSSRRIS